MVSAAALGAAGQAHATTRHSPTAFATSPDATGAAATPPDPNANSPATGATSPEAGTTSPEAGTTLPEAGTTSPEADADSAEADADSPDADADSPDAGATSSATAAEFAAAESAGGDFAGTEFAEADSVVIPPSATGNRLSWVAPARATRPALPKHPARAKPSVQAARSKPSKPRKATKPARWLQPISGAVVTSCFGQRWGRLHAGVDLAAPYGTAIRTVGAGIVVAAGPEGGYGNAVLIDHGDGFLTHYGHMSAIAVHPGQRVTAGQPIGNEGSTGHSTGPHLHFEVHQGTYKNPIEPTHWLHTHGVEIPGCPTFPHN